MRKMTTHAGELAAIVAGLATFGAFACEPIPPVPADLQGGVYCLTEDMSAEGGSSAFQLGSDTTLDCQGHSITEGVPATVSLGITTYGTDNVVVRNCVIDGFPSPIAFGNATHFRIESNQIRNTTGDMSIAADGNQGLVAGNTIRSRPGSYLWRAIVASGLVDVIGNTVIIGSQPDPPNPWYFRNGIGVTDYSVVGYNLVYGGTGGIGIGIGLGYYGLGYRNVVVIAPGANLTGMTCPQNSSARFGNVIIGADGSPEVDCSTNRVPRLKAIAPRSFPLTH